MIMPSNCDAMENNIHHQPLLQLLFLRHGELQKQERLMIKKNDSQFLFLPSNQNRKSKRSVRRSEKGIKGKIYM